MITHTNTTNNIQYWITYNNESDVSDGTVNPGATVSTGNNVLEVHDTFKERSRRLGALRTDFVTASAEWQETVRLRDPIALLSDLRWRVEVGGLTLPNGISVITTRESQAQINGAVNSLSLGLVAEPVEYKLASGWQSLSAAEVTAIAGAIAKHVAACFSAERKTFEAYEVDNSIDIESTFMTAYTTAMGF